MKKIFVVLLVLATMGFGAFAQDAKPVFAITQYMDVSATLDMDNALTPDVYNETYLNYKASDMGFSATVVSGADLFAAPRNLKIYYNAFDGMLTLSGGILRETGSVRVASYVDGNGFSTRLGNVAPGMLAVVKPVAGLVVAAFLPATGDDTYTEKLGFGVGYLVADVANIVAGYRMINKELWVSADVKAVKDVSAYVGFKMVTDVGNYIFVSGGTSLVAGLDLGLDANVLLPAEGDMGYGVKVKAEYGMAPYAFGVKVSYDNAVDAWYKVDGVSLNPYARWDFSAGDILVGFTYDTGASAWTIPIEFELSY